MAKKINSTSPHTSPHIFKGVLKQTTYSRIRETVFIIPFLYILKTHLVRRKKHTLR